MHCHRMLIFVFVSHELCLYFASAKNCSLVALDGCPDDEICLQTTNNVTEGTCSCQKHFVRAPVSGKCEPEGEHYSQDFSGSISVSAIAVGLLVPAIAIVIIGTLILLGRRYRWIRRFRDQAHQLTVRNYDNVLVSNQEDQNSG